MDTSRTDLLAPADLALGSHAGGPHARSSRSIDRRAGVDGAIERSRHWLLARQQADGHWCAELEGDTILESEYILLLAWLGRHRSAIAHKAARYILEMQLPTGGWSLYPGGKVEISGSVKAYFALKLTGHDPTSEPMIRARRAILAHGGADAVNSFTRFYLALLGQISYDHCPEVPPELTLLPSWFPINLYKLSAWTRTIVVPLSIMSACRPKTELAAELGIHELFIREPKDWPELRCPGKPRPRGPLSWDRFFRVLDRMLKVARRLRVLPRRRGLAAAERWMVDRFADSDGLGAIFPPMVWSVIALKCLGYKDDSPELRYCHERLEGLILEEDTTARLQPCKSPVWDTAIALRAVLSAGAPHDDHGVAAASQWLLSQEVTRAGDWSETVDAPPGGWCFEYANAFYPDVDDTAMVMMALGEQFTAPANDSANSDPANAAAAVHSTRLARMTEAIARANRWMLAMQNRDGGWGAFDRDNDSEFLCHVPFADHNAMIDPSTPDLAGRALEALGTLGRRAGEEPIDHAVAYLRRTQEPDGSWFGRWGVNHIYGTWQVVTGLRAVGVPADDRAVAAGVDWLLRHQQASGAWGESADSYENDAMRGRGAATPSQTAWAVLALVSAGLADHPATRRGVGWLVDHQNEDGSWDETEFTGTGFPLVFYLKYHMYRVYFPLLALARWKKAAGGDGADASSRESMAASV